MLLIIGARYGTVIKRLGISVTEYEFDAAYQENPKKVLVFVQNLSGDQREAREEDFLKKISDINEGHGLFIGQPFRSKEELYEKVKSAISNWVSERVVDRKGLSFKGEKFSNKEERYQRIFLEGLHTVCL